MSWFVLCLVQLVTLEVFNYCERVDVWHGPRMVNVRRDSQKGSCCFSDLKCQFCRKTVGKAACQFILSERSQYSANKLFLYQGVKSCIPFSSQISTTIPFCFNTGNIITNAGAPWKQGYYKWKALELIQSVSPSNSIVSSSMYL